MFTYARLRTVRTRAHLMRRRVAATLRRGAKKNMICCDCFALSCVCVCVFAREFFMKSLVFASLGLQLHRRELNKKLALVMNKEAQKLERAVCGGLLGALLNISAQLNAQLKRLRLGAHRRLFVCAEINIFLPVFIFVCF